MLDVRSRVVMWARWAVAHQAWFEYEESRPFPLYEPTAARHIANDCSATSTLMLWLAGAPEPFPGAFTAEQLDGGLWGAGNTESYGQLPHVTDPVPGDFVVYGLGLPLGDQHMATVLEAGSNPLTMSHGMPSEPALVRAIEGCPPHAQGRIAFVRSLPVMPPAPVLEADMNPVITKDPNNGGLIILDTAAGTFNGIADPATANWLENICKIPVVPSPPKAVFAKFKQVGTI